MRQAESGVIMPALEKRPEPTQATAAYIHVYANLHAQRIGGMNGIEPIPFSEIEVYLRLFDFKDLPFIVEILAVADRKIVTAYQEKQNGRQNLPPKAGDRRNQSGSVSRAAK